MDAQTSSLKVAQDTVSKPRPLWLTLLTPLLGVAAGSAIYILAASLIYLAAGS